MQVARLQSFDEVAGLADRWNALAQGVPFRTWEWNSTWWRHYQADGQLYVLAVRDGDQADQIVALAPWHVSRHPARGKVVRFLASGEVCSDYQTILCQPGREDEAVTALADWLVEAATSWRRHDAWDLMDFSGLEAADPLPWLLLDRLGERGCQVATQDGLNCWRLEFPPTWDEYVARLSKSHRGHVRRMERNVYQAGRGVWRMVRTADELPQAMDTLIDLHQRRWSSRGLNGVFTSPRFTAFHGDIVQQFLATGNLRLQWLELDGRPAAAEYHFAGGGISYFYQSGVAPELLNESPGALAHIGAIQLAWADGLRGIDFLRGNEPYKRHWRAEPRLCRDVRVVPPRLSSRLRSGAWETGRRMKHVILSARHVILSEAKNLGERNRSADASRPGPAENGHAKEHEWPHHNTPQESPA